MRWITAAAAGIAGNNIAREIWPHQYLFHNSYGWWLQPVDPKSNVQGVPRVVQAGDFGLFDWQATDWQIIGETTQNPILPPPPVATPSIRIRIEFADKADDDIRLTVGGVVVTDQQRNIGWYGPPVGGVTPPFPPLDYTVGKPGDYVAIDCFDGWGPGWHAPGWTGFVYTNGILTQTVIGPAAANGMDGHAYPGYLGYYSEPPTFQLYISMGGFTIT